METWSQHPGKQLFPHQPNRQSLPESRMTEQTQGQRARSPASLSWSRHWAQPTLPRESYQELAASRVSSAARYPLPERREPKRRGCAGTRIHRLARRSGGLRPMGPLYLHRQNRLPARARPELPPVPSRPAERSAMKQARLGHRERNTSRPLEESAGRLPRDHPALRPRKTAKNSAPREEELRQKPGAQTALRPPAKRQWRGNRPHSTCRWAVTRAVADPLEWSADWARRAPRMFRVGNPEPPLAAPLPKSRVNQRRWAKPATPGQASSHPAALRKTRSRASQSLPDRVVRPSRPACLHTSADLAVRLLARKTMSASRSRCDHLYSWY